MKKRELPRKRDKNPDFRSQAKMSRDEVELLMSAPQETVPIDRLVFYALEIFGGMRFGEAAGRKWAHYDPGARPLGRIRCATQYDGLELKGGGREREIPVHPVLAALLEEWRTIGFPALFGRAPKPDDWIVPSRLGRVRSVSHMYKKQAEDFERLDCAGDVSTMRDARCDRSASQAAPTAAHSMRSRIEARAPRPATHRARTTLGSGRRSAKRSCA